MALKEIKYTAVLLEYERGWGQRVDEVREFDTEAERDKFIRKFNAKNNLPVAPDWYMIAERGADKISDPQ